MMKRLFVTFVLGAVAVSGMGGLAEAARAAELGNEGFDANYILSDDDIFNASAFPFDRMVNFLRAKGTLAAYRTADIDGVPKTAAEIIWRVSQSYKINPKYLIALLQKEQSLVEDPNPSQGQFDWATGYGVCDSCAKDDPSIQDFKGFAAQLEWAAKQHREKYLIQLLTRGLTIGGQGVGKTVQIDGQSVTPVNNATAMLYTYTPHIHGNLNLWRIWQRWYGVRYPDGTIARAEPSGKTYLLRFGEKRPFASNAVLASRVDPSKIIRVSDSALHTYPDGAAIKFSPYALLRDPDGKIFLLVGETKRHIANMAAFRKFSFNEDEIENAEREDLAPYADGLKITVDTQVPQGTLMKTATGYGVWYVEDGKRHPLIDASLLKLYFRGRQIKTVTQVALDQYEETQPYHLHDGELVKSTTAPTVYVVENQLLRPIPSADIFESVGWKWNNVVRVPDSVIAIHSNGDPFDPSRSRLELAESSL